MDKLLSLLNQPKALERGYDAAFKASLFMAIKNGTIQAFIDKIVSENVKAHAYAVNTDTLAVNVVDDYDITDPNLPENSIAVIDVEGAIYPWKAYRLEQMIMTAEQNPNIIGTVLFVNTPGGYIHRVDITADAIKNATKPIAAYCTGLCASAGMWLVSGADRIFAASKLDTIGSIGVMTTYSDSRKYWEEMGFIDTDIYATKSTRKNEESREAEKGNFEPIVKTLDFSNEVFHATIRENRNVAADSEIFTGAVYKSEEAITLGLVDEIADFDTVLHYIMVQGMKQKANSGQRVS